MSHPYTGLPADRFWRTGVADLAPKDIAGLWQPKFAITPSTVIATAGSCFAQHFSRALRARGYSWRDFEPSPIGLPDDLAQAYHYGVFSFRTGNIYTPKMLRQWLTWAFDPSAQPSAIWQEGGRYYDPLRPAIEPSGFDSAAELHSARETTFAALRACVAQSDVFVFTMGLTEAWINRDAGFEYALCPGTGAGQFDAQRDGFVNHPYDDLLADLRASVQLMRGVNPQIKLLLTVSPVPLTATASGAHVLMASSQSKSVLRAVAVQACELGDYVDYFPSYEIITHPVFRGAFFAPNMRSVLPKGVDFVMQHFFSDQARAFGAPAAVSVPVIKDYNSDEDDLACEEAILSAFAPSQQQVQDE
jgi:hypothetical protein